MQAANFHEPLPNTLSTTTDQLVPETMAQVVLRLSGVVDSMQGRLTTAENKLSTAEGKIEIAEKQLADMSSEVGRQGMLFVPLESNAALQLTAITTLGANVVGVSTGHTSDIAILSGRLAGIDTQLANLSVTSNTQSTAALAQGSPANLAAIQVNTAAVAGLHHSFHTLQAEVKVLVAGVKAQEEEKKEKAAAATDAPGAGGKGSSGDKHEEENGNKQSLNRESGCSRQ